jgi:MFS family permease
MMSLCREIGNNFTSSKDLTMVNPFMPLFAHQIIGADEFILGALGTARFFVPFILAIPTGRLADRWGRKKFSWSLPP